MVHWQKRYRDWCKASKFLSMLPEDTKERRAAALERLRQTEVEDHFRTAQPSDKPPPPSPYTDELFKKAAIQWLVETDQVSNWFKISAIFVWWKRRIFKCSNILPSRIWYLSLPMRLEVPRSLIVSRLEKRSFGSLRNRCRCWRNGWMYVWIIFFHYYPNVNFRASLSTAKSA